MWPLHYTSHPIFDVGLAAITVYSRKPDPAKLTETDLEDVDNFIERYYTRPPFSTFLTISLMNSDFTQPAYKDNEERKRAYARLLARSLAPELHQSNEVCAFIGLPALSIPLSIATKEDMPPGRAYRQHLPVVTGEGIINFSPIERGRGATVNILLPGALFAPCELLSFFHRRLPHKTNRVFFTVPLAYAKAAPGARQNVPDVVLALSHRKTHPQSVLTDILKRE